MNDHAVIAVQAAQIARLRDCLRQLVPIVRFHAPEHPGIAVAQKLLKERIAS